MILNLLNIGMIEDINWGCNCFQQLDRKWGIYWGRIIPKGTKIGDQLVPELVPDWDSIQTELSKATRLNLYNKRRGEGSRGGRVIDHDKNGNPIY